MAYSPKYQYVPPADYHFLTKFYDFFCFILGLGGKFKKKVLDLVSIPDGAGVLDVGCGTGILVELLKRKLPNSQVVGIDPDDEALQIAKERLEGAQLSAELKKGYAEVLPFPDESFDFCLSTLVFHHLPNEIKLKTLQEMHRVLKPGGKIVITDFGKSESKILRLILSFEEGTYLEGNLQGLIPQYISEANFQNQRVVQKSFFSMETIIAEK